MSTIMLRKTIAGAACGLIMTGAALAQSAPAAIPSNPAKAVLAREIIAVSLPKDYMQRTLDAVSRNMGQQMAELTPRLVDESIEAFTKARNLTEEERRQLVAQRASLVEDYRKQMLPAFDKGLREMYARVDPGKDMSNVMQGWYEQNFTEADLRQILAFQKTPVAAKLRDAMPQFMAQVMPQIMGKVASEARTVADKAAMAPPFADMVSKRLCSDKAKKFCK